MDKETYLRKTAEALVLAAQQGVFGRPIQVLGAETIAGPRAGAVRLYAGLQSGLLYRILSAQDCALARQFIAWPFPSVQVYFDGAAVRVEAPWPPELATKTIYLRNICRNPRGKLRWAVGVDEIGRTVIGGFSDSAPHWLVAGTTGSGKTTALLTVAYQLTQDPQARLVLLDGKGGASLAPLANAPNVLGPIATSVEEARAALRWVWGELQRRYASLAQGDGDLGPGLCVIMDEFQEFAEDPYVAELLRRIVLSGRAAKVHCLLSTQHPTIKAFGGQSAIKRNLPGRLALRVLDGRASEVVIGASVPRADALTGAGDAYVVTTRIHRVQVAMVGREDWDALPRTEPEIPSWGDYHSDLGAIPEPRWSYSPAEVACGLVAAYQGWGRVRLLSLLQRIGAGAGSIRADRLLSLGRATLSALSELGYELCQASYIKNQLGG
jgi:hypothetical protein